MRNRLLPILEVGPVANAFLPVHRWRAIAPAVLLHSCGTHGLGWLLDSALLEILPDMLIYIGPGVVPAFETALYFSMACLTTPVKLDEPTGSAACRG